MPFAPGPFAVREEMPLGPRVSQPGDFESLAAGLLPTLAAVDAGLGQSVSVLAPLTAIDLDGAYAEQVAPAFAALDAIGTANDAAELVAIASIVDAVVDDIATQALDLPSPFGDDLIVPGIEPTPDPGTVGRDDFGPGVGPGEPPPAGGGGGDGTRIVVDPDTTRAAIRGFYLELLQREPDPGGWSFYTGQVEAGLLSLDEVRANIFNSDEYRVRHGG